MVEWMNGGGKEVKRLKGKRKKNITVRFSERSATFPILWALAPLGVKCG